MVKKKDFKHLRSIKINVENQTGQIMTFKFLERIFERFILNEFFIKVICGLKGYNLYTFDFTFPKSSITKVKVRKSFSKKKRSKILMVKDLIREKIKLACRNYLILKYYQLNERERRKFINTHVWGVGPGEKWHQQIKSFYTSYDEFLDIRKSLIRGILAMIRGILAIRIDEYDKVVEIGTGNGWFLDVLSKKIRSAVRFIGLDLNKKTIKQTKLDYKHNKKLEFICSDVFHFAKKASFKKAVVVSCFVLEYFSKKELVDFCRLLIKNSPCFLAILERVNIKHKNKEASVPVGNFSYSHNYEAVFAKTGMEKRYTHRKVAQNDPRYLNLTAIFKV